LAWPLSLSKPLATPVFSSVPSKQETTIASPGRSIVGLDLFALAQNRIAVLRERSFLAWCWTRGATISYRLALFQLALMPQKDVYLVLLQGTTLAVLPLHRQCMETLCLLEMMGKPDDADGNEIDRDHVIEQTRHEQNQDSGDQGDQWVDQDWIKVHGISPRAQANGPIRLLDDRKHKRSARTCRGRKIARENLVTAG
jgi:hypothetical protein